MVNNIDNLEIRIDDTEKKLLDLKLDIWSLNEEEKLEHTQKIEKTILKIKEDLDNLKKDTNLSSDDLQKLSIIEWKYNKISLMFESELNELKLEIETLDSEEEEKKDSWWNRNKKTVLIWASTLWVWLLVRHWWKKRKERKEKEKNSTNTNSTENITSWTNINVNNTSEKKSWRKRPLVRWWGIVWWVLARKNWWRIKEKLWFWMSFEDSLWSVKWDLNNISESKIKNNMWDLIYDETSWEIRSYWKQMDGTPTWVKIDKKKKKIEWLDTKFSSYKELIFMANFINYLKYNYKWKWADGSPFYSKSRTWDLYMKIWAHIDWEEKEEEVISGGMWSTLRDNVPSIDPSSIKKLFGFTGLVDSDWKSKLVGYLNNMDIREKWDAPFQENPNNDPIISEGIALQKKIHDTAIELNHRGNRWTIESIKLSDFEYDINSRSFKEKIIFKPEIKIEGMDLSFPTVKEAMRTATLINKMKYEYWWKSDNSSPFSIEYETIALQWWLMVNQKPDWFFSMQRIKKTQVLTEKTLIEDFPTIHNKANRDIFLNYINNLPKEGNFNWWT